VTSQKKSSSRAASAVDPAPVAAPATTALAAPSAASMASLVALGSIAALWAAMLWGQLLVARAGGTSVCLFGAAGSCAAVWDSSFALAIHRVTGVPVAGWGVAWGIAAAALPLIALLRVAEGRPEPALLSASRVTAAVGIAAIAVLMCVTAIERAFCGGCFVSDLIVAGYAGIALPGWSAVGLPQAGRGLAASAVAAALAFVLVLYPGLHTPPPQAQAGREAVESAASDTGGEETRDQEIARFLQSLPPQMRQDLSDSLATFRGAPEAPVPEARELVGPADAPVRITEFTDVRCTHCAELHATLESLRQHVPQEAFSIDTRQFPLDPACNPLLKGKGGDPVRCLAAKAQICVADGEKTFAFAGALFKDQKSLTPDRVLELAAPYMSRDALKACIASPATEARLREDVTVAGRYNPEGTPLVLVNGRKGVGFGPFLFAMILTGGSPSHPAFDSLPPARVEARSE
jgi:serine/threonine-protein kinase